MLRNKKPGESPEVSTPWGELQKENESQPADYGKLKAPLCIFGWIPLQYT
jgi:hypothetical protein